MTESRQVCWLKSKVPEYRDLILQYKQKYPLLRVAQLSRLIIKEQKPGINENAFRKVISFVFGEAVPVESINLDEPKEEDFLLPRSDYKDVPFFKLPKCCDNIMALFDIHIPYHSIKPLVLALKYGRDHGINTIFLGGDIMDCSQLSRFVANPNMRNFKGELTLTKEFLAELRRQFPDVKIYYKMGNHSFRFYSYIFKNAPAFADIRELSFERMLDFDLYRVELIQFNQTAIVGRLNIIHGNEVAGSGINMARNKGIKAFDNILFGHHHLTQFYPTRTIQDKQMGSWSVGCLCGLKPDYNPINNWNNGFAHIEVEPNGNFTVHNKTIVEGQIK